MLHSIRKKDADKGDGGVVGMLLECHERIRTFSEMTERLSTAHDAPPDEIAAAAARVRRYFSVALPKHEEDEERSIAPRLLAAKDGDEVAAALETMAAEHRRAHELLAAIAGAWDVLVDAPRELARLSGEIARPSAELCALLADHVAKEESAIFPRIDRLAPEEREAIRAEMRARRDASTWLP